MRILVIEDEQKVARALREGLEAEGYEVTTAATGEEGFFLIHAETFDLVILDLMLPGRDGVEVLNALRRQGLQIPVFILTARDAIEDRVMGLDSGADDYLIKPFAFPELLARVRALLLALAAGYFLAGRVLSPVRSMAAKAEEITAERLSERLPVENPEDEFGRLATVFNQTLSRLEESFQSLRRFTADASHELRTPLTALRSVGEVGLRDHLDLESSREVIGSMLEETDRLARLVDSLLTLTRADAGKLQLNQETVDLTGLVENVADHLQVLAEDKNQTLSVEPEENGIAANVDRSLLRHAIINLLDNAIKYTQIGGRIRLRIKRLKNSKAAIEIMDQGPGIPPEHQQKIFERFYRIEKGRSRDTGGTGLGLAIARWAVETNGGRIEVESHEGHGSVFRILLPAQETTRTGPTDVGPIRKGGYK